MTRFSHGLAALLRPARLPGFSASVLSLILGAIGASCGGAPDPPVAAGSVSVAWHRLGTWAGRGHRQTESFTSDASALRVHWEATRADSTGGVFRLTIHSAISGRPLEQIVDHAGPGKGTAYLYEDPRVFHAVVDSHGLDWTFTVEEAVVGVAAPAPEGREGR